MDSWEDRRFFLGFANEKDLQTLTDPETRVSRVPLFYTCFLRVLQGKQAFWPKTRFFRQVTGFPGRGGEGRRGGESDGYLKFLNTQC